MREQLLSLLEPPVGALGYELVDVEFASAGSGGLLRLYIDAPAGITVEDCERVSHRVSEILDVADPIPGAYTLEVSSPGLDRILRTREHFERFRGQPYPGAAVAAHRGAAPVYRHAHGRDRGCDRDGSGQRAGATRARADPEGASGALS